MNLEHEKAQNIADKVIEIPVNVGLVHHKDFGAYLIDAGLDASYVDNPHGTIKGIMVETYLAKGSQEPNTHIAAILEQEKIQLQGVFLTHLHKDHTAGIVDLPKDIPYVAGRMNGMSISGSSCKAIIWRVSMNCKKLILPRALIYRHWGRPLMFLGMVRSGRSRQVGTAQGM